MITQLHNPRFAQTRINGAVNYSSRVPIPLDVVRRLAPSIFAEQAHGSRSDKYTYIPTSHILEALMKEGFQPYSIAQGGSRDETKRGFTKHQIRLRHDSEVLSVNQTHNEIVLLNSHDGTSSYRLSAGVFRLVCSNGLVVAESLLEDVKVPHKGDVVGQVLDGCIEIMDRLPVVSESIRELDAIELSPAEQRAFSVAAIAARYDDAALAPITADQANRVRRTADIGGSIWKTLNRNQEALIRGGDRYTHEDDRGRRSRRTTREVRGIDQNTAVNRALWALAEEMRNLKTA